MPTIAVGETVSTTPPAAILCFGIEGAMTRQEIISEIHHQVPLFRQRADDFCDWVEQSVSKLKEWAQKPIQADYKRAQSRLDNYRLKYSNALLHAHTDEEAIALRKRLERIEKAKPELPAPDWGMWSRWSTGTRSQKYGLGYGPPFIIDSELMEAPTFFAPPEVVLPINWLVPGGYNPRRPKPDEQIRLDFFLLAVLYSKKITSGEADTIFPSAYPGSFNRDHFSAFLWSTCLADEGNEDANGRIERAWDWVQSLLLQEKKAGEKPNGQEQAADREGGHQVVTAEMEPLQQTAQKLRAFANGKWIGKELSQQDCVTAYDELMACIASSFAWSLQQVSQHGYALSADNLRNRQHDLFHKARTRYLPNEPNVRVLFPDNLRVEILSFAEEIERTVAGVAGKPADREGKARASRAPGDKDTMDSEKTPMELFKEMADVPSALLEAKHGYILAGDRDVPADPDTLEAMSDPAQIPSEALVFSYRSEAIAMRARYNATGLCLPPVPEKYLDIMDWCVDADAAINRGEQEMFRSSPGVDKPRVRAELKALNEKLERERLAADEVFRSHAEVLRSRITALASEPYIPYMKAIGLSNGVLTRKKLDKAITEGQPVKVRDRTPRPQRREVHIQDVLQLIDKLTINEGVKEEAARMFGEYKRAHQSKQPKPDLS
jgi:hypothetical protein